MRKILVSLLAVSGSSAFAAAADYSQFQAFDNEVSVGYGMVQSSSTNIGGGNNIISNNNNVYLVGERLLDNGIWIDVTANMAFGSGQNNSSSGSANNASNPSGGSSVPSNYGVNGKVGYAFSLATQHLLLTPYALAGLNNNAMAQYNNINFDAPYAASSANTSNQFFYTGGIGGRIEYRINHAILVYADQSAAYNWDQSGPQYGLSPQDNVLYTSTVGAKFNIVKDFQLGAAGFYQNYQPQTSAYGSTNAVAVSQPQSGLGGLVTVGLTY